MLASKVYGLCDICPQNFNIEDAFLAYGIPYSTDEDNDLVINLPEIFVIHFQKQFTLFHEKRYTFFLARLNEYQITFDKSKVFELLMSFEFYEMLKISPNENVAFIKEKIDLNALQNQFSFNRIEKINSNKYKILTNMDQYFDNMEACSINIPEDQSYGPDIDINLPLEKNDKSIFVGLQAKNYFSGKTTLTEKKNLKEVEKMLNIINSLGEQNRKQYKRFYYVIICPSYGQNIMTEYFNEEYIRNEPEESFSITKKDYSRFPLEGNKFLKVILLHPDFVSYLVGQEFIDFQNNYENLNYGG